MKPMYTDSKRFVFVSRIVYLHKFQSVITTTEDKAAVNSKPVMLALSWSFLFIISFSLSIFGILTSFVNELSQLLLTKYFPTG